MVGSNEDNSPGSGSRTILKESTSEYYFDKYIMFIGFGSAMVLIFSSLILTILKYIYTNFLYNISFIVIAFIIIIVFVKYFIINGINRKRIVMTDDGIILPFPHKKNPNNNFVPISDFIKIDIREERLLFDRNGWNYILYFRNGQTFLINQEIIGRQNQEKINYDIKILINRLKNPN